MSSGRCCTMMRFASLLTTWLLISPAIAQADCSWSLGWPNDERIWAVPWGGGPRGGFLTRIDCERAIDTMLGEAVRGQALLIELPTCVCVPGYDDFARKGPVLNNPTALVDPLGLH